MGAVFSWDSVSAHLGGAFPGIMAWFSTMVTGLAGVVDPGSILVPSVVLVLGVELVTGVPIPSVVLLKASHRGLQLLKTTGQIIHDRVWCWSLNFLSAVSPLDLWRVSGVGLTDWLRLFLLIRPLGSGKDFLGGQS